MIAKSNAEELGETVDDVRPGEHIVTLMMPKFKIEYNFKGLPEHLKGLGVSKLFAPGQCDFGNLLSKLSFTIT